MTQEKKSEENSILKKGEETLRRAKEHLQAASVSECPTAILGHLDLVYVLSARYTVSNKKVDTKIDRETDAQDDLTRLLRGIEIADINNAFFAGKLVSELQDSDRVTPIYYNGTGAHNRALKKALETESIPYPARLFIIGEIQPENTIGQTDNIARFLASPLVSEKIKNIGFVSNLYHGERIALGMSRGSPRVRKADDTINMLGQKNLFFFAVDKQFKRTGVEFDLLGEYGETIVAQFESLGLKRGKNIDAIVTQFKRADPKFHRGGIMNYSTGFFGECQPSIASNVSNNIFFTNDEILLRKSLNLQKRLLSNSGFFKDQTQLAVAGAQKDCTHSSTELPKPYSRPK